MAQADLQQHVCRLDSPEGAEGVCGISSQVGDVSRNRPRDPFARVCVSVDSVIASPARYGLPLNYQALLLQTDRKRSKKLEEELSLLFMHLDPTAAACKSDVRSRIKNFLKLCIRAHMRLNLLARYMKITCRVGFDI